MPGARLWVQPSEENGEREGSIVDRASVGAEVCDALLGRRKTDREVCPEEGGRCGGRRRGGVGRALHVGMVLAVLLVGGVGGQDVLNPKFQWSAQTLYECQKYYTDSTTCECYQIDLTEPDPCIRAPEGDPDFEVAAGRRTSCTSDLSVAFSCPLGSPECTCEQRCTDLETDWNSFPSRCDVVVGAVEDTWTPVSTYFVHDPGLGIPSQAPSENPFTGSSLRVTVNVTYGDLDVYDTRWKCSMPEGVDEAFCTVSQKLWDNSTAGAQTRPDWMRYGRYVQTQTSQVVMIGSFTNISLALDKLMYRPFSQQNSLRLRSRIYSSQSAKDQPFEVMRMSVEFLASGNPLTATSWNSIGTLEQLVYIVNLNDSPQITNPRDTYMEPAFCTAQNPDPRCHFGMIFSYEDTDATVEIKGVEISDDDVYESCQFNNPECAKIDVSVSAANGAMGLNTKSRLSFYEQTRSTQGFTSVLSAANSAVRVLNYRVEETPLLGPTSSVNNYNTQHSSQTEVITVTVSDQGFSGAVGVSEVNSIDMEVIIVATNDAPVIAIDVLEYTFTEDVLADVGGIAVTDVDVEEQTVSTLSQLTWTNGAANMTFLNNMHMILSVNFGVMRLRYTRNLRIERTAQAYFASARVFRFGHDLCRIKGILDGSEAGPLAEAAERLATPLVTYKDVCVFANMGATTCPTGSETSCTCLIDDECNIGDASFVLYINTSSENAFEYISIAEDAVLHTDRTCGGMPIYPKPNNFTSGLACKTDDDCAPSKLPACTPGVDCKCCANITHTCSSDDDCQKFDVGSHCGCVLGGVNPEGVCGPYCQDPRLIQGCLTDFVNPGRQLNQFFGQRCTFSAPFPDAGPGFTRPSIRTCRAPSYVQRGADTQRIQDLVSITSVDGSRTIGFFGSLVDMNRAIESLTYITNPRYNRLYRPPLEARDPLTFDIEADSVDVLTLLLSDLGNSGGTGYDPRIAFEQAPIRVQAVNNRPSCNGPLAVTAFEDIPFHFVSERVRVGQEVANGLSVSDPDYLDYQFEFQLFTVNISCSRGRLFLNEEFTASTYGRRNLEYKLWDGEPDQASRVGVHSDGGPIYGDGCQFEPQCTDTKWEGRYPFRSNDDLYGFYESVMFGVVYGVTSTGDIQGCGVCPENTGNRFISVTGTMQDINMALERVTYLPDPNFNTRYGGNSEFIRFQVTDNGALGNDGSAPALTQELMIDVTVESINDKPIIGRRVRAERTLRYFDPLIPDRVIEDWALAPINKTFDEGCMLLAPSSPDYGSRCRPGVREFIDVDEDTVFVISPDILWINDIDSVEAEAMPALRRYCCEEHSTGGCVCGQPCICGATPCPCSEPDVCLGGTLGGPDAGDIEVTLTVSRGSLSFYPPPGRVLFDESELVFLTNLTVGGVMEPCPVQLECMRGAKRMTIRTTRSRLQLGLEQRFLSYVGDQDYYGRDVLEVQVNDHGMTHECYNETLVATETVNIRIIAVNDPPTVSFPTTVLIYEGTPCYADFHEQNSDVGTNQKCLDSRASNIPPNTGAAAISFGDADLTDVSYGNVTVVMTVGNSPEHANAGAFFLPSLVYPEFESKAWYEVFRSSDGLNTMAIQGTLDEVNWLMNVVKFDAYPGFRGYVLFRISINDMGNYGECAGLHVCGQDQPCADHNNAGEHVAATSGITVFNVDAAVGTVTRCQEQDCDTCNKVEGCGWCPGACTQLGNGGKCMIGGASKPLYEACPADITGKQWRQCSNTGQDFLSIGLGAGGALLGICLVTFALMKWAQRRHGSIIAYARKKRADLNRTGQRLKILPPESAKYTQFFFLVSLCVAAIIMTNLLEFPEPTCVWRQEHFLDTAAYVHLSLDACTVRFVPASSKSHPENQVSSIKINFAYQDSYGITLDAQTCGANATFMLVNQLRDAEKYKSFYCNVEIIVPEAYIVPHFTIMAVGENTTFVRAGPMDLDSRGFGLNFGPNGLELLGTRLVARLENVTAKSLLYDVKHGACDARDVSTSSWANFTSETGDIMVSTKRRTTVKFLQRTDNSVCLTAANGSVYVDNSCKRVCTFMQNRRNSKVGGELADPPSKEKGRDGALDGEEASSKEQRTPHRFIVEGADLSVASRRGVSIVHTNRTVSFLEPGDERRQITTANDPFLGASWECFGDPSRDTSWNCSVYDPVQALEDDRCPQGAVKEFKSQLRIIPGCVDVENCIEDESSQCLCKPSCDMANLNPPGTCNDAGECCQTICQGYSTADLFPDANQPRCGIEVDPIAFPWCDGKLDQLFTFTSTSGQIDVQVLRNLSQTQVTSFKSSPLFSFDSNGKAEYIGNSSQVTQPIGFADDDKRVLDEVFHKSDANFPQTEWFEFRIRGPGLPERPYGQFLWVSSVRYLILQPWLLKILSLSMVQPERGSVSLRLAPGFCPANIDANGVLFNERLKVIWRELKNAVELYPATRSSRPIPATSLITFRPVESEARLFAVDANTGGTAVNLVQVSDYPLITALMLLTACIPFVVSFFIVLFIFLAGRRRLAEFRDKRLVQEHMSRSLSKAFTTADEHEHLLAAEGAYTPDRVRAMVDATSFFYMFEEWLGYLDVDKSLSAEVFITVVFVLFVFLPASLVYSAGILIRATYVEAQCEYRPDRCKCLSEVHPWDFVPNAIQLFAYVYCGITCEEMSLYFLRISHNIYRRITRVLFYTILFLMWWFTVFLFTVVAFFICIGVFTRPVWLLPYAIAFVGLIACVSTYYFRLVKFRTRVRKAVECRLVKYRNELLRAMPATVIDVLIIKNMDAAMADNGQSQPQIITKCLQFALIQVGIYGFLFVGFAAFTQRSDQVAGGINSFLVFTVALAGRQFAVGFTGQGIVKEQVTIVERKIMVSLRRVFEMVTDQVDMARRMFLKMRFGIDQAGVGETDATSEGSSSGESLEQQEMQQRQMLEG